MSSDAQSTSVLSSTVFSRVVHLPPPSSLILLLAAGLLQLGLGVGLLNPAALLAFVEPATTRIEALTGLPALVLGNNVEPALAIAAVLQLYLAYLTLMAVYTNDEKYKRNSTPGRVILGVATLYVCQKTDHGSSFVAFIGIGNTILGLLMGLTVGFGDGNAVDLELAEAKLQETKEQ